MERLADCVEDQTGFRPRVFRDSVQIIGRDGDVLRTCAQRQADQLEKVAVGRADDTGPGRGRVTFYDVEDGDLVRDQTRDVPAVRDRLRVESVY